MYPHTLYSHGQRGAEMSLTMGTCPVRGGSALIKCADPNCKAFINQVASSAHTLLRPRNRLRCQAAASLPFQASARSLAEVCCCVEAIACMQCAHACCKGLTRARRIRRTSTTPSCAMSAPQSHSAAMARGCAGACVPCVVRRAACCNRVHAPHSPPLGLCARVAIMPRFKGGLHMKTLRAGTAGPVRRQKSSRAVCASPRSPGLTRDAPRAHAQSAFFFSCTMWPTTVHSSPDSLCRFSVPEYNPRPTGGWSHGKGKARKRLLLHSKRLDKEAEVSDVLDRLVLQMVDISSV